MSEETPETQYIPWTQFVKELTLNTIACTEESPGFAIYAPERTETKQKDMKEYLDRNDRALLYSLIIQALTVEGEHHKQWYLQRIAEVLEADVSEHDIEEGIAP
jgi:hypothetical protein